MNTSELRATIRGKSREVVATTPHGSYLFEVVGATPDLEGRLMLLLKPIEPEPPTPCSVCGCPRDLFPMAFMNDATCSVACQKAAAA